VLREWPLRRRRRPARAAANSPPQIAQSLWVAAVHRRGRWRETALAAATGAAWWLATPYSLLASTVVYYNMLSLGYYVADLCALVGGAEPLLSNILLTRTCAVQLVCASLFWLAVFVGFTQNPLPLDCALLPIVFAHDCGAHHDWLNRAAACKNGARSHAQ